VDDTSQYQNPRPFGGTPNQAYARSGIGEAVKAAGGQMEVMARMKWIGRCRKLPYGKRM